MPTVSNLERMKTLDDAWNAQNWTCTIARWTGRMIGPVKGLDGKGSSPTNKPFELEFCTVAR